MAVLRIALSKGRLLDPTLALFATIGIAPAFDPDRRLVFESTDGKYRFLLVKPVDVPTYVEQGAADAGVVGGDVLLETERDVLRPLDLAFGACRLVVAAPIGESANSDGQLHRVATKYPRIAEQFFKTQRIPVETIVLGGSVELAPSTGLADWIVDLVETGRTLHANNLEPIAEIASARAQLIVNRASQKTRRAEIEDLIDRLGRELSC